MKIHKLKKIYQLGLRVSTQVFLCRMREWYCIKKLRLLARFGKAHHQWSDITQEPCEQFFKRLRTRAFTQELYTDLHADDVIKQADDYAHNCFDLLGSGKHCFVRIPWHRDFKVQYAFPPDRFYKDITITSGNGTHLEHDIKVPWELSRFHQCYVLGKAYNFTKDKKYSQAFVHHMTDWIDNNPVLYGVNWLCPMEVGIRAINWIWGMHFFMYAPIDNTLWQRVLCSLYDHMYYLEHNWEWYDGRTSNHYLSDLVGYFYLCWLFDDLPGMHKKRDWCYDEIVREFNKQISPDGTSYEGSTAYHQLVTELFSHFIFVCNQMHLQLPASFLERYQQMLAFCTWCTPVKSTQMICIGDNDSGNILLKGLVYSHETHGDRYCPNFGISIYRTDKVHISLRHHVYTHRQPSGHFHNDAGSITLAINGIPIFVDPGSYVYTPSVYWRNYFRSVAVHNTCFLEGIEPVPLDNRLFALDLPEHAPQSGFTSEHDLYERYGLRFERTLHVSDEELRITDSWSGEPLYDGLMSAWNFTLAPDVQPYSTDQGIMIMYKQKPLVFLSSDALTFVIEDCWVSPKYGHKSMSKRLRARAPLHLKKFVIRIDIV